MARRGYTWPGQVRCRNRGKAVIVQTGRLSAGREEGTSSSGRRQASRKLGSILVLLASAAALALIVMDQTSKDWLGPSKARVFP